MQLCEIMMLGRLMVVQGDREITRFRTQKTAALLAYLAFYPNQAHSREILIDMLWPDATLEDPRNSLSKALSSLRQQLEPPNVRRGSVLVADNFKVQLNPEAITTDVLEFERHLQAAARAAGSTEQIQQFIQAVELYRGVLLPGFYEEWVVPQQARLEQAYFQAVRELLQLLENAEDTGRALHYAGLSVGIDPLREEAHLQLIRLHVASGQMAEALRRYEQMERLFKERLGSEPSAAARALGERLRAQAKHVSVTAPVYAKPTDANDSPPIVRRKVAGSAPELPAGTATWLVMDVIGASQDTALRALWAHNMGLLREIFRRHEGLEVQRGADSCVAAFGRAHDALEAALASWNAFAIKSDSELLTRVRMAIHTGDSGSGNGKKPAFSQQVAFSLLAAGHGGQLLCTESTAVLLRSDLDPNIQLIELGTYRLSLLPHPEPLFQIDAPEMPVQEFPALNAPRLLEGHLPLQMTRFFGRKKEIEALASEFETARLITLTGPGGSGKTRVSIELGKRLQEEYAGAVWFIALQDVNDPNAILDAVRSALELPQSQGSSPLQQIAKHLGNQPCLIVLDNMEQLVPVGADVVKQLLETIPELKCVITSRHRLNLQGEREFPVSPLPVPKTGGGEWETGSRAMEAGFPDLTTIPSVQLFIDRAQAVVPDFQLTAGNADAIAEICCRLEGVPLAIELAAARVSVLTPIQIAERLNRRLDLLVSRQRDRESRHSTLRAAIDWSYEMLPPELQTFFQKLSVFRGGWTLDAAETVCSEPLAIDYLTELVERSLITTHRLEHEVRFGMLETLREYAEERLPANERADIQKVHALFYLQIARQFVPPRWTSTERKFLERVDREHNNLRAALSWALEADQLTVFELVKVLWHYWEIRGHWIEGRAWISRCLEKGPCNDEQLQAGVLAASGRMAYLQGDHEKAFQSLEEALFLYRKIEDLPGTASTINALANIDEHQGSYEQAWQRYAEALHIYRSINHQYGIATCLNGMGTICTLQANFEEATCYFEEGLTFYRAAGDLRNAAGLFNNLGIIARRRADYPRAVALFEEALAINREIGNRPWEALNLMNLGNANLDTGHYAQALEYYQACAAIHEQLGDRRHLGAILANLGNVSRALGHYRQAHEYFEQALRLSREQNNLPYEAHSLRQLCIILEIAGDLSGAKTMAEQGLLIMRELGDREGEASLLSTLGDMARKSENFDEARRLLLQSLQKSVAAGLDRMIWPTLMGISRLCYAQGDIGTAIRLYAASGRMLQEQGSTRFPDEEREAETYQDQLRQSIEDENFQALFEEGSHLSKEEAIELAHSIAE
jgi:predicted ATPase/DNA-binding SARP family transcriptional activator/uncharacterized protein HemY